MEKSFPHFQEDVRAIQASFQMYLVHLRQAISPDDLLQAANSQRRDIYQLFFEALEEQKVDLEPLKSYLRGKVPPYYQQDLEQAFTPSAGAVAMETSTTLKGKQVSGTWQPHYWATHTHTHTMHEALHRVHCSCHPLRVLGAVQQHYNVNPSPELMQNI